jgi:hypothetical protein
LVALLAIFIALRSEAGNQARFNLQLSQSKELALASARPILAIEREGYEDVKALAIANHGPGTAIITDLRFVLRKEESTDLGDLIELGEEKEVVWNEIPDFRAPFYLPGKSSEDALRITDERLVECGFSQKNVPRLLGKIEEQLDAVEIFIKYEDVFGSKFELIEK